MDTTCYVEDNNCCGGAYIKDNDSRFVQAFAKKPKGTPSIAEAMRVLKVLQYIHDIHYDMVQIETNCLQVV
jgi:hypothetical protein